MLSILNETKIFSQKALNFRAILATKTRFILGYFGLFGPQNLGEPHREHPVFVIRRSGQYLVKPGKKCPQQHAMGRKACWSRECLGNGQHAKCNFCSSVVRHAAGTRLRAHLLNCQEASAAVVRRAENSDNEEVPAEANMNQEQQLDLPHALQPQVDQQQPPEQLEQLPVQAVEVSSGLQLPSQQATDPLPSTPNSKKRKT